MRGANFMRLVRDPSGKETCHLLDWHSGSIKAVTRSTFVSELQAAIFAADSALMLGLTLHETKEGLVSPRIRMCIDFTSMFSALSVDRVKPPAN